MLVYVGFASIHRNSTKSSFLCIFANLRSNAFPGVAGQAGKELPERERRLNLRNRSCEVQLVLVLNNNRTECSASGNTFSQDEIERLWDFNAKRMAFHADTVITLYL